jgi:ribosomal protein L32
MRTLLLTLASLLLFTGVALADDFDNWGTEYYDQVIDTDYGWCDSCNHGRDSCGHASCDSCSKCHGMKAAHSGCDKCGAQSIAHSGCSKCGAQTMSHSGCSKCGAQSVAHSGCSKCGAQTMSHSGCDKCGKVKSECRTCNPRPCSRCG